MIGFRVSEKKPYFIDLLGLAMTESHFAYRTEIHFKLTNGIGTKQYPNIFFCLHCNQIHTQRTRQPMIHSTGESQT